MEQKNKTIHESSYDGLYWIFQLILLVSLFGTLAMILTCVWAVYGLVYFTVDDIATFEDRPYKLIYSWLWGNKFYQQFGEWMRIMPSLHVIFGTLTCMVLPVPWFVSLKGSDLHKLSGMIFSVTFLFLWLFGVISAIAIVGTRSWHPCAYVILDQQEATSFPFSLYLFFSFDAVFMSECFVHGLAARVLTRSDVPNIWLFKWNLRVLKQMSLNSVFIYCFRLILTISMLVYFVWMDDSVIKHCSSSRVNGGVSPLFDFGLHLGLFLFQSVFLFVTKTNYDFTNVIYKMYIIAPGINLTDKDLSKMKAHTLQTIKTTDKQSNKSVNSDKNTDKTSSNTNSFNGDKYSDNKQKKDTCTQDTCTKKSKRVQRVASFEWHRQHGRNLTILCAMTVWTMLANICWKIEPSITPFAYGVMTATALIYWHMLDDNVVRIQRKRKLEKMNVRTSLTVGSLRSKLSMFRSQSVRSVVSPSHNVASPKLPPCMGTLPTAPSLHEVNISNDEGMLAGTLEHTSQKQENKDEMRLETVPEGAQAVQTEQTAQTSKVAQKQGDFVFEKHLDCCCECLSLCCGVLKKLCGEYQMSSLMVETVEIVEAASVQVQLSPKRNNKEKQSVAAGLDIDAVGAKVDSVEFEKVSSTLVGMQNDDDNGDADADAGDAESPHKMKVESIKEAIDL